MADQCYGLSENFLEVYNLIPDGGAVSADLGASTVYTCPGDGQADIVSFSASVNNRFYTYVVTDESNTILQVLDGNTADFEQAGTGVCRVWGVASVGDLNLNPGDKIDETELASVCFSLSNNFVEVIRENPVGGSVALTNGETSASICLNEGPTTLAFESTGAASTPFTFLITDDNNNILEVLDGNTKDFSQTPPGTCRVWGVSYTGNLTALIGENASAIDLSDDCYDLSSNFITVVRNDVEGGNISLDNGETEIAICVNDGSSGRA